MGLPSVINGIDGSAQRRFSELHVHARVLDTGDRTISIDQIATVSVENRRYRLWRWLAWGLAAILAAVAVGQIVWPCCCCRSGHGWSCCACCRRCRRRSAP